MIFINFFVGCGWGYGNYRNNEQQDHPVFIFMIFNLLSSSIGSFFSGGILGWDPVRTTCIPDEMMMRL